MASSYDILLPHPRHIPTKPELLSSQKSIDSLNQEIEGLQRQIDELQARVQHLRRKRDNHASYISPFRCLPPEILDLIVQISLENGVTLRTLTQICGSIRDVVNGMTIVWSKISLQNFAIGGVHPCRKVDQLDIALKRAGSTPLDIYINRQINSKEQLLLASHHNPIQSLKISYEFVKGIVGSLYGINLHDLRCLGFIGVPYLEIQEILESALESTHKEMDITISLPPEKLAADFLKHDLFQRASRLRICLQSFSSSTYESASGNIYTFPHLKRLEFEGKLDFFYTFDITHAQSIYLHPGGNDVVAPMSLPVHLTKLHLKSTRITSAVRPDQAHCLPQLALLKLEYVSVEGALSQLSYPA